MPCSLDHLYYIFFSPNWFVINCCYDGTSQLPLPQSNVSMSWCSYLKFHQFKRVFHIQVYCCDVVCTYLFVDTSNVDSTCFRSPISGLLNAAFMLLTFLSIHRCCFLLTFAPLLQRCRRSTIRFCDDESAAVELTSCPCELHTFVNSCDYGDFIVATSTSWVVAYLVNYHSPWILHL